MQILNEMSFGAIQLSTIHNRPCPEGRPMREMWHMSSGC